MHDLLRFLQDNLFIFVLTISDDTSINLIDLAHVERIVKNMALAHIAKRDSLIGDLTTKENLDQTSVDVFWVVVGTVNILFCFL